LPILAAFGYLPWLAAAQAPNVLEEIIVTAGFRDLALMTSPGSATVIDETVLRERAARHLESILNVTPNVSYASGASRARFIQIRGVGDLEQFVDPKHFPSVGISVDDIDLGGTANAAMLFDTEQVEILRGPQGTRFGTSALAGLVNVRGRRPSDSFEGYVEAGVADYGTHTVGGAISGPLGKSAGARLAVQQHTGNGYIENDFLSRDDTNGYDETSARLTFEFDPRDTAAYSLTALYFDGDNGYDAFSLDNDRHTLSDQPGHDRQHSGALAARGEWALGSAVAVHAVATWLDSGLEYGFDEDWTYVGICDGTLCDPVFDFYSNADNYLRDRVETSADVRVLIDAEGARLRYVFGIYGQRRDEDLRREYYGDFLSAYETERDAIYGQVQADAGARFSVTAGLRYERFSDRYGDSFALETASADTLHSGEISIAYQASEDSILYAMIARGNKAGGVNMDASANAPLMQPAFQAFIQDRLRVERESLLNTELGVKGTYLDGRLALRAALFHMNRDNAQIESWIWDGVNFLWVGFLDNVDGSSRGAEVELAYDLTQRWRLFASLGRLDTELDRITTFDLDLSDFVERDGIEQAKAPNWQYHIGASFAPSPRLGARIELEGRDASRFGYYHDAEIGAYRLVNASIRYRFGNTELQLWGRNLTDEEYAVHGLYFGNDPRKGWVNETYRQLGEPRVVGLGVRHTF
jgi:outer membrane receptor protein involved in Fe transport